MAISFISVAPFSSTTTPVTSALAIATGDTVFAGIGIDHATVTESSVTDNNASPPPYNSKGAAIVNGLLRGELWGTLINAGKVATQITSNMSGNPTDSDTIFATYRGALSLGNYATNSGSTANPSIALTLQEANNWMLAWFFFLNNASTTAGTGNLRNSDSNVNIGAGLVDNTSASAGSLTCSVTHTAVAWVALAIELRTVTGGAPISKKLMRETFGAILQESGLYLLS